MTYAEGSIISITPDDRWEITITVKNGSGEEWSYSPQFVGWAVVILDVGGADDMNSITGEQYMRTILSPVFIELDEWGDRQAVTGHQLQEHSKETINYEVTRRAEAGADKEKK